MTLDLLITLLIVVVMFIEMATKRVTHAWMWLWIAAAALSIVQGQYWWALFEGAVAFSRWYILTHQRADA